MFWTRAVKVFLGSQAKNIIGTLVRHENLIIFITMMSSYLYPMW